MAEIVPTFVIHNMFKAQSSRMQRAHAPVPHTATERLAGRRILPKRPITITEAEFKANEAEILTKVREGRFAVTCPDLSFIDSLPDGRLVITHQNKKTEEEPSSPAFKKWPYQGAEYKPQGKEPGDFSKLEDLPKEVVSDLTLFHIQIHLAQEQNQSYRQSQRSLSPSMMLWNLRL